FDGKLGLMQGIIVTPSGDVWILGIEKSQLLNFPKGDITKGQIVCEGDKERHSGHHFTSASTSRTGSGCPIAASHTSRASPLLIRARLKTSRPGLTIAVLASTAEATSGSPTGSALGYWAWPI